MDNEKRFLFLAFVVLAGVLFWDYRTRSEPVAQSDASVPQGAQDVGVSNTLDNSSMVSGPSYMTYNQPWAFSPPIANFLPASTVGQEGQVVLNPTLQQRGSVCTDGC